MATGPDAAADLMARVNAAFGCGDIAGARPSLEQLAALLPGNGQVWRGLGQACLAGDDFAAAEHAFRRAVDIDLRDPRALDGLGIVRHRQGDLAGAEDFHRQAAAADPVFAAAWCNLGIALTDQGDLAGAGAALERALAVEPGDPTARFNLAIVELTLGNYARGWELYEARLDLRRDPTPPGRRWRGEPLGGAALLLLPEQGFGDLIQFARFLPILRARGAAPVLAAPPQLLRLFQAQDWGGLCVPAEAAPAMAWWCPVMSLGAALELDTGALDGKPYLSARPRPLDGGFRVGLAWAGNPTHRRDRWRSIPAEALAPLLGLGDVTFALMQVGRRAGDAEAFAGRPNVVDLERELTDFQATAAAIAALDLVISADTAVLHLAGAMGVPAWGLLPHAADWRWGVSGDRTAWYDSVTLYRQEAAGDWDTVIARVAKDLAKRL